MTEMTSGSDHGIALPSPTQDVALALRARHLSKSYGSVKALRDVSFDLGRGEIVGLVGDNGAGKSTLVSLLAGAAAPSAGSIEIPGVEFKPGHPSFARDAGIEVVFQDLALSLDLDVADNVFLGREITRDSFLGRRLGWLDRPKMRSEASALLDGLDVRIRGHRRPVKHLSGGQRQGVAVARAVAWASSVLLLDEPTAALGVEQQESVGAMMKRTAANGVAVLLVSHNLPQVISLCDRVLVLRHGSLVATLGQGELAAENVLRWITGAGEIKHD